MLLLIQSRSVSSRIICLSPAQTCAALCPPPRSNPLRLWLFCNRLAVPFFRFTRLVYTSVSQNLESFASSDI